MITTADPTCVNSPRWPARVSDREAQVFAEQFRQVSTSAYLLARQIGRDPEQALDMVQEAALRAWRYRHTRKGDFRSWFLSIVLRLAKSPIPQWIPLPPDWRSVEIAAPLQAPIDPDLMAALTRLPQRQRAAIWLRYCEDMSTEEVAVILDLSESATKQVLYRGREALRKQLRASPLNGGTESD